MTVVGIECDGAAFQHHFKKVWKVTVVGIEFFQGKILQARLQKGL